jgi:hypothetical protein
MRVINYAEAKLYKIECLVTHKIYIGSTCQPTIRHRLKRHVNNYKNYKNGKSNFVSSFNVLENDNYIILLIEKFPCECRDELTTREGELIKQYWNDDTCQCVNRNQAGRGQEEYIKDNAENAEKICKQKN